MKLIFNGILAMFVVGLMPTIGLAEWSVTTHEGDELKGTPPYHSYSSGNNTGKVILYDSPDAQVKLVCADYSFFNSEGDWGLIASPITEFKDKEFCNAKVGIYLYGKLIKSGNIPVFLEWKNGNPEFGFLPKGLTPEDIQEIDDKMAAYDNNESSEVKLAAINARLALLKLKEYMSIKRVEIYNALCQEGMSVRIVAPRYGKTDFDVTVHYDKVFRNLDWIPENKNQKLIEMQKKRAEVEATKRRVDAEKKLNDAIKSKSALERKCVELTKKESICRKNELSATLKSTIVELKKVKAKIAKLDREIETLKDKISKLK